MIALNKEDVALAQQIKRTLDTPEHRQVIDSTIPGLLIPLAGKLVEQVVDPVDLRRNRRRAYNLVRGSGDTDYRNQFNSLNGYRDGVEFNRDRRYASTHELLFALKTVFSNILQKEDFADRVVPHEEYFPWDKDDQTGRDDTLISDEQIIETKPFTLFTPEDTDDEQLQFIDTFIFNDVQVDLLEFSGVYVISFPVTSDDQINTKQVGVYDYTFAAGTGTLHLDIARIGVEWTWKDVRENPGQYPTRQIILRKPKENPEDLKKFLVDTMFTKKD